LTPGSGTSHELGELGQNFARAFGTRYSSDTGEQVHVWQTSWGVSTRLIGALIMAHGDDAGLRLPPRVAPVQAVVVLVRDEVGARSAAEGLVADPKRAGHRVALDDRLDVSFGRRAVEWGLKGVPVRVEVGPRALAEGNATLVQLPVPLGGLAESAVTVRCLQRPDGSLALSDDEPDLVAVVGRDY
jgi:prolyl-tRNA synthetase